MSDVTRLLDAMTNGEAGAANELFPIVYDELRRLAAVRLAHEKPGQTLNATALVHEAYLRLIGGEAAPQYVNRSHFVSVAASAMRRILIDNARRKKAAKRGGNPQRHELDGLAAPEPDEKLLALDEALTKLAANDPQKARLVELRYFAGMTGEEATEVLGISPTTADRYWAYARAYLQTEARGE
jgi:RNA polymerase sigma factor (TIGR02999 family)